MNEWLLKFAEAIGATSFSIGLHESYYMYAWIESIHVITLTISLGMLIVIDLRMLGAWLKDVPASKIAQRLETARSGIQDTLAAIKKAAESA